MDLYKRIPYTAHGRDYEIRVLHEPGLINVAVFLDNRPANGFRYQIQVSKSTDVSQLLEKELYTPLVDHAKDDIQQKRWGELMNSH